jgi:hypothetical protein
VLLADPRKAREVAAVHLLERFTPHSAVTTLAKSDEPQSAYAVLEAQARLYAAKLGFKIEDGETVWTALLPFTSHDVDVYAAVKGLSDHNLERLHTLLTALSLGQVICERLDTRDSLFNRVAVDLCVAMRNH